MTIDTNQFWNLLSASQLLKQPQIQTLFAEFAAGNQKPADATAAILAQWLIKRKTISNFQAKILLAGQQGPFHYGNYTLVERFDKGHLSGSFAARHRNSQYGVLLEFVAGNGPADLNNWKRLEALTEIASTIEHPNLLSVYESVALPNHRFIVSQLPDGVLLASKLPRKARLPWQKACLLLAQVASGLERLHAAGIVHGSISPRTIWIHQNGLTQLRLNLHPDLEFENPATDDSGSESKFNYLPPEWSLDSPLIKKSGDIYAMGCVLFRAIAGRVPFAGASGAETMRQQKDEPLPNLEKYELPQSLVSLMRQMLDKDPAKRIDNLLQLSGQLAELSGKPKAIESLQKTLVGTVPQSLAMYRQSLDRFRPGTDQIIVGIPNITTEIDPVAELNSAAAQLPNISAERTEKINAATAAARRRKQNRWKVPAAVAAALLLLSVSICIWAINADRRVVDTRAGTPNSATSENTNDVSDDKVAQTGSNESSSQPDLASMAESERPILIQQVIADDTKSLWESPTTGAPVDFSGLPAAPKMMFVFRMEQIVAQPEGLRVIQSLGSEFGSLIDRWKLQSGLELSDVSQLIVSLYSTPEFLYEPFYVVTTRQPLELDRLLQIWNRPSLTKTESGQEFYVAEDSGSAFYVIGEKRAISDEAIVDDGPEAKDDASMPAGETQTETEAEGARMISRFVFGSRKLVEEVANNAGATPLTGAMRNVADWTDQDRHINVLYLRNALFNDEGQHLMGTRLRDFNRALELLLPDDVRGGLLSMHIADGTYLEMMFDRNLSLKPPDLQALMVERLRNERDQLTQFVAAIPASSYWDKVRLKYDNMLADVIRNLRWNVEHGEVVANCWLPPMAAHNLLASSELVVSFAAGSSSTSVAATPTGPQTIDELLAVKRDLNVANPPDLNLLMSELEADIKDEFGSLPFEFHIRLLGSDLQKDGITQNQRPGELKIEQKSLSEILTQIMAGANPSKDISGPSDPNCKLIWVVADDPELPGQKAVLITTRAAAAQKSYTLPAAFKSE